MSHLSDVAATLNAGEWGLLCEQNDGSNYGNPIWPPSLVAVTGVGFRIFEYASTLGYDPHWHRLFYAGGAHSAGNEGHFRDHYGFIAYDIPTNHWTALEIPPESILPASTGNPHPYNLNHVLVSERVLTHSVANTGQYYRCNIDEASVSAITSDHWTAGPASPKFIDHNGRGWHVSFPERDSVLRYIPDAGQIQEMKHTESSWRDVFAPLPEYKIEGSASAYSHTHKKVMFGGGHDGISAFIFRFWLMSEDGTFVASAPLPNDAYPYFIGNAHFWADPISGDFLVLTVNGTYNGYRFYRYDVDADSWNRLTSLESKIPTDLGTGRTPEGLPYDLFLCVMSPLRDLGVTVFCGPKVYIYKHAENSDANGLSHARKTAQPGTVAAYGFDSSGNVRTHPATQYPMRYTQVTGSCMPILGTNYPYDPAVRGVGEANARAVDYGSFCVYPAVDNTVFHAAGGGAGALRIDIPTNSPDGVGGYFDTPYQGVDFPKVHLTPSHFGRVWYQWMMRTENVTPENLRPSIEAGSGVGPKFMIGASRPPYIVGSDPESAQILYLDLKKNGVFNGYTYSLGSGLQHFHRTVGSTIYIQNEVACEYLHQNPPGVYYPTPPCVKNKQNEWQRLTAYFELRPAAVDFVLAGDLLTKPGFFTMPEDRYKFRWVYLQSDGWNLGGYFTVAAKVSNDTLQLNTAPLVLSDGPRAVVISDYPNSLVEMWIDSQKIIRIEEQPIFWDGADIESQNPAGFASFRLTPHMTGKDPTVTHLPASIWFDDLIISTEPIPLEGSTNAMPTNPLIAIHEGKEKIITAEGRGTEGQTLPTDTVHFTMEWTALAPVVGLAPIAGTNTCKLTFIAAGQTTIQVKGDADPTTGVQEIFGSVDVEAIASTPSPPMAVTLVIIDGPETPIP